MAICPWRCLVGSSHSGAELICCSLCRFKKFRSKQDIGGRRYFSVSSGFRHRKFSPGLFSNRGIVCSDVDPGAGRSELCVEERGRVLEQNLGVSSQCGVDFVNSFTGVENDHGYSPGYVGEKGFWSVIIPTYNRLPILSKCLKALEEQVGYEMGGIDDYEVVVVDDGSTDGTVEFLSRLETPLRQIEGLKCVPLLDPCGRYAHVKLIVQDHAGATKARNLGLRFARGSVIVFIDSDVVVAKDFLRAHGDAIRVAFEVDGDDRAFTYGTVINTNNFENPRTEKFKITDYSAAFFATGNVAISRQRLLEAGQLLEIPAEGPFDADFSEYGWEDLELGVRLRKVGARIKHAPAAIGFHWHPPFSVKQLPNLIEQERQRGRNGVRFYNKHPSMDVRLMIQMTPFHYAVWFLLTLGGIVNEKTLEPLLDVLVKANMHGVATLLVSPLLNWYTAQAVKEESRNMKVS